MRQSENSYLLPRELAPGVQWLGECLPIPYRGEILHSYDSLFLVSGTDSSVLLEAGLPLDFEVVLSQLERALDGRPPLSHIFLTHQETPHSGGLGEFLERYPEVTVTGDVRDYHLFFPQHEERMSPITVGDSIDLGGSELIAMPGLIRDLNTTLWAFETKSRTLFVGDGFAYSHYHAAGQCGHTAGEVPTLDIAEHSAMFVEFALPWMAYVDVEPFIQRLIETIEANDVQVIAPTHGLPITDPTQVMPAVLRGIRAAGSIEP